MSSGWSAVRMEAVSSSSEQKPRLGTRVFIWSWSTIVIGTIAVTVLFVIVFLLGGGTHGLLFGTGKGHADSRASLEVASPDPWRGDRFLGYSRFTAEELNRIEQGHDYRKIKYVEAEVESTDRTVVSVNPIDDFTWVRRPSRGALAAAT